MARHGEREPRGIDVPRSRLYQGRFGRIFRNLPPYLGIRDANLEHHPTLKGALQKLTRVDGPMLDDPVDRSVYGNREPDRGDSKVPAGYTYLGQFIDHDITFDPTSSLEQHNDPDALHNFRSPRLDLDSVYGAGPDASPYLYDGREETPDGALLVDDRREVDDLPRNYLGTALTGDPRNDENRIVGQLQLAVIKFHNAVLERKAADDKPRAFERAQQTVRWHYQWVVVHDFLDRLLADGTVSRLFNNAEKLKLEDLKGEVPVFDPDLFDPKNQVFMPVEFSVGAYRFGHSMARPHYQVNAETVADLFEDQDDSQDRPHLGGGSELPPQLEVDWARLFDIENSNPQKARQIDTRLAEPLLELPMFEDAPDHQRSLAYRNLKRGFTVGLPSGQGVAKALGFDWLNNDQLGLEPLTNPVWGGEAPLWLYVLGEAAHPEHGGGNRLGQVGGLIVAEVLLGLIANDPLSYWNINPTWQPEPDIAPQEGQFTAADLVTAAERLSKQ